MRQLPAFGIEKAVMVDDFVSGIGKKQKVGFYTVLFAEKIGQFLQVRFGIYRDGQNLSFRD